jgi:hypothetical protein
MLSSNQDSQTHVQSIPIVRRIETHIPYQFLFNGELLATLIFRLITFTITFWKYERKTKDRLAIVVAVVKLSSKCIMVNELSSISKKQKVIMINQFLLCLYSHKIKVIIRDEDSIDLTKFVTQMWKIKRI